MKTLISPLKNIPLSYRMKKKFEIELQYNDSNKKIEIGPLIYLLDMISIGGIEITDTDKNIWHFFLLFFD